MSEELIEEPTDHRVISGYGIGSVILGVVALAAVVLATMIWSNHRRDVDERRYQTQVLQAAADWTGVLINMSKDTVGDSVQKLRDGTVGQLNVDFDKTMEPFEQIVAKLQSKSEGQVDSVAIESLHHSLDDTGGKSPSQPELDTVASRTDTVLVVATSVSQNVGAQPQTVRWTLRLGVSDVEDKLLVSRLEVIR